MDDALLLSRIQFAFVISFHILFPAFTIGLASWLAFLEGVYLWRKDAAWRELYFFWLKIFAVSFGMGVVSGIVMSFQFGTNWARFSEAAGNVIGPLLSYEVLTAFFLEAGFLGVMLFGWRRVSPRVHFFCTVMVALGTLLSTFWITSANSWMHTPAGYVLRDGADERVHVRDGGPRHGLIASREHDHASAPMLDRVGNLRVEPAAARERAGHAGRAAALGPRLHDRLVVEPHRAHEGARRLHRRDGPV